MNFLFLFFTVLYADQQGRQQPCSIWSPFQVYCTVCTSFHVFLLSYARIRCHIKHVSIRCVRSASRGFITSMKVAVSSLPPQNRPASSNATIPGMNGPPIYVVRGWSYARGARGKLAALGRHVNRSHLFYQITLLIPSGVICHYLRFDHCFFSGFNLLAAENLRVGDYPSSLNSPKIFSCRRGSNLSD